MAKTTVSYKWSDRKRIIFGLPWTFTKYAATDEKLLIRTGDADACHCNGRGGYP